MKGGKARAAITALVLMLTTTAPAAALLAPLPAPAEAPLPAACEPAGTLPGDAAALATCAALALANGDVAGARSLALDAAGLLYANAAANPIVLETYAHQFALMQNPVRNPGFSLAAGDAPFGWTGGATENGALVVSGAPATQAFGAAASDADLSFGVAASPFWSPETLGLTFDGNGTVTVTLAEATMGATWTSVIPLVGGGEAQRFPLLDFAPATVEVAPGTTLDASEALLTSALVGLTIEAADGETLVVDDILLDGVAYGPDPRVAIDLDRYPDTVERAIDIVAGPDGVVNVPPVDATDDAAHDGHTLVVLPLDVVPSLLADGTDPATLQESARAALVEGDWTFFVGLLEETPSGPRFVAPASGAVTLNGIHGGPTTIAPGVTEAFDEIVALEDAGTQGALFAQILAAQGFTGVVGGLVTLEGVTISESALVVGRASVDASRYDGATSFAGYFNYAKFASPGRALHDATDVVPQSVYAGRQLLGALLYASERQTDANDGFVASVVPMGYRPIAEAQLPTAEQVLVPDASGDFTFTVAYVDYAGEPVSGTEQILALVRPADVAAALTASPGDVPEWMNLSAYRVCTPDVTYFTCEQTVAPASGGALDVAIPSKAIMDLTDGLGGEFAIVTYMVVAGGDRDVELLDHYDTRGVFSKAANGLLAAAAAFESAAPVPGVGPAWLYAAADAASVLPTPLRFLPYLDGADGVGVLLEPLGAAADDPATLVPDAFGNYNFDVTFRGFSESGLAREDLVSGVDDFSFELVRLPAAAPAPLDAVGNVWTSATSGEENVTVDLDSFAIRIPAWDIPYGGARTPVQPLAAWAELAAPYETSEATTLDPSAGSFGGYYHPAKLARPTDAVIDQLDAAPAPLALARQLEEYALEISDAAQVNLSRETTEDLVFNLTNAGTFTETIELSASVDKPTKVAFTVCPTLGDCAPDVTEQTVVLEAGDSLLVTVRVTPNDNMSNDESAVVTLAATLSHPVRAVDDTLAPLVVEAAGTLAVTPFSFAFTRALTGSTLLEPGETGEHGFTLANGPVTETFLLTTAGVGAEGTSVDPASQFLGEGASSSATASYGVPAATLYGSVAQVRVNATPTHGGTVDSEVVGIAIPGSALNATGLPTAALRGRPGDVVAFDVELNYQGPYSEPIRISATSGIFGVPVTIGVPGHGSAENALVVTFDGDADADDNVTHVATLSLTIPEAAFNATSVIAIHAASQSPNSRIGTGLALSELQLGQVNVRTLTAALSIGAPSIEYALPGEVIEQTYTMTYLGEFDATWAFAVDGTPFGATAVVTPSTLTFEGAIGAPADDDQTVTVSFTIPPTAGYGVAQNISLRAVAPSDWRGPVPATSVSQAKTFTLAAPVIDASTGEQVTFPRDVPVEHTFEVELPALPSAEQAQWNARPTTTVSFDVAADHTSPDNWSDELEVASVTLAPGASAVVNLTATPLDVDADDTTSLTATSTTLANELEGTETVDVALLTADDITLHLMLVGCYGDAADACGKVAGPMQALTTHDAPEAEYSRVFLLSTPIVEMPDGTFEYVDYDPEESDPAHTGITSVATATSLAVDPTLSGETRAFNASSSAEDSHFFVQDANGFFLAALAPIATGSEEMHGVTTLLWDTSLPERADDVAWFLAHLGTLTLEVSSNVHGIEGVSATYDPLRAILPLLADVPANAAVANIATDKDDQDGDGYSTLSELRGNSNPAFFSSTPYTDDDGDSYSNVRDVIPVVDEECLITDAEDEDWFVSCLDENVPALLTPPVSVTAGLGPAELAPHVLRLLEAFSPAEG